MTTGTRHQGGFTLVEVIAAGVILSGAVVLVGSVGTQAMIGTGLNRRYEMAASLIDTQLNLIDYLGIDTFLESGETEGTTDEYGHAMHWQVETEYLDMDSLYRVRITVTWIDRNRPYTVTVDTMLNGNALMEDASGGTS